MTDPNITPAPVAAEAGTLQHPLIVTLRSRLNYNDIDALLAADELQAELTTLRASVAKLDDLLQQQHEGTDAVWNEKNEVMKERDELRSRVAAAEAKQLNDEMRDEAMADDLLWLCRAFGVQEKDGMTTADLFRECAAQLAQVTEARDAAISLSDEWQNRATVAEKLAYFAFVAGAKWWQYKSTGFTAFGDERREMEDEAEKRYPYAPHPIVSELEAKLATVRQSRARLVALVAGKEIQLNDLMALYIQVCGYARQSLGMVKTELAEAVRAIATGPTTDSKG